MARHHVWTLGRVAPPSPTSPPPGEPTPSPPRNPRASARGGGERSAAPGHSARGSLEVPLRRVAVWRRRWHSEAVRGWIWVGPAFLYLALFIAYPFAMSAFLSLSNARVGTPGWSFVELTNFRRLFADPVFWQTVRHSFVFTFGSEAIRLVIGLPLAFALNRSFKGKRLVQASSCCRS